MTFSNYIWYICVYIWRHIYSLHMYVWVDSLTKNKLNKERAWLLHWKQKSCCEIWQTHKWMKRKRIWWIGWLRIVQKSIFSKLPFKFVEPNDSNRRPFLWKLNKLVGFALPDFKSYYKTTVIKRILYWYKYKQMDEWQRIYTPDSSYKCSQFMSKVSLQPCWRGDSYNNWSRNNWTPK